MKRQFYFFHYRKHPFYTILDVETEELAGEEETVLFLILFDLYIFDFRSAATRGVVTFTEGRIRRYIEFAYSSIIPFLQFFKRRIGANGCVFYLFL